MSKKKKKKKKNSGIPRRLRFKRDGRLQNARSTDWINLYSGKNLVRGYAKWYGVNLLTAIAELRMLGVDINENYVLQVRQAEVEKMKQKEARKRKEEELLNDLIESYEYHYYDVGYSSEGVSYTLPDDESKTEGKDDQVNRIDQLPDELPF